MAVIYIIGNCINDKVYIGKDKNNNPNYFGSGVIIRKAIKKYGKENFSRAILEECDLASINLREVYWINLYNSITPKGYNITSGGEGGDTFSNREPEAKTLTREKMSKADKRLTSEGKGAASFSVKGKHITETNPDIENKWRDNYLKSMELVRERYKLRIKTNKQIQGLAKSRIYWSSTEARKLRQKNAIGVLEVYTLEGVLIHKFEIAKDAEGLLGTYAHKIRTIAKLGGVLNNYILKFNKL